MRRRPLCFALLLILFLPVDGVPSLASDLGPHALPLSPSPRLSVDVAPGFPSPAPGTGARRAGQAPVWDSQLRGLWVDAFHDGIKTPAQIAALVANAHTANANALFVQVRKRGDSYYNASVEPRATDIPDPDFDPLANLIAAAHGADPPLKVLAWVVTFPVWPSSSTDPRHVYLRHGQGRAWDDPENWLSYQYTGGKLVATDNLDPGHPDAARYTVDVCLYLARHYDIDGLVLDYIRYLGQDHGYNMVSEQRYHAAYGGAGHPASTEPTWMAWRREQVTNVVRRIYLETLALKPDLILGAATIAWGDGPGVWENTSAYRSVFQDWRAWLEEGIIDLAVPMNYDREYLTSQRDYYDRWIEWEKDHQYGRAVAPSPAAYLNYVEDTTSQVRRALAPSAQGNYALGAVPYSYAVTNIYSDPAGNDYFTKPPRQPWVYVPSSNAWLYTALAQPFSYVDPVNGATYYSEPAFVGPAPFPDLPWKSAPTLGHLAGWAIGPAGPLDRVPVQVTGPVHRTLLTDANGFFGAVDLPPGDYSLTLPAPASSPLYATVTAGRVALATVAPPDSEPALRALLVDAAHDGFKTPDQVDVLLADARAAHLNTLLVQVRRFGQVYYDTPLEPRAADPELPAGFDPLAYLLQQAHTGPQPLEVYAWLSLLPAWDRTPGELPAGHVLAEHPDWASEDITGTQVSDGAYYLDPGHPGVLTYTTALVLDLLNRYEVDGLLLDGLHYPHAASAVGRNVWGYNPVAVQRYRARYGGAGDPAPDDPLWLGWRREQLSALLRRIYLRCGEGRPDLRIAAVGTAWGDSPDYAGGWESSAAYGELLQDWRGWTEEGIVDLAAPMNYDREYRSDQRAWYDHWLAWESAERHGRGTLVLSAAYLNYPEHTLQQAQEALGPSRAVGLSAYRYGNLYADPEGDSRYIRPPRQPWYYSPEAEWWLWRALALPYGYTDPANGAFTTTAPLFPGVVPAPALPWRDTPILGHAVGLAQGPAGPLDGVTVTLNGPEPRVLQSDGGGFFGAVDLPPGAYTAEVAGAAPGYRFLVGAVAPGEVVWLQPCRPVEGVSVSGPAALSLGRMGSYTAAVRPPTATLPLTVTWSNGTVGASATYSWTDPGAYTVTAVAFNLCGRVTATLAVTAFCQPLEGVAIAGPLALLVDRPGTYRAVEEPLTASLPITFSWSNGAVGPTAAYSWSAVGRYTATVTATNRCGEATGTLGVRVLEEWPHHVYLPLVGRPDR